MTAADSSRGYLACDCGKRVHPDDIYTYSTFASADADVLMACHECILTVPDSNASTGGVA